MYNTVIFDMDGLMFDTESSITRDWVEIGRRTGWPITYELAASTIGLDIPHTRDVFVTALGNSFDFHSVREQRLALADNRIKNGLIPKKKGLNNLLDYLWAHKYKTAVATSTYHERTLANFRAAGLENRFDALICGDMVHNGKPAPDIFLAAAAACNSVPENCIVLEDSPAGIEAAHSAGMLPVMIPDLLAPTEHELAVCVCLSDLDEVISFLKDLSQAENGL